LTDNRFSARVSRCEEDIMGDLSKLIQTISDFNPGDFTENAIGSFPVPIGLADDFVIDGRSRLVTMATEERSVVAAANYAAKLCLPGGFVTYAEPHSSATAQIMFSLKNAMGVREKLYRALAEAVPKLAGRLTDENRAKGRGETWVRHKVVVAPTSESKLFLIIELRTDPGEAMGAGLVTRIAERVASELAPIIGCPRIAAICTNADLGWQVEATARWNAESVGGYGVIADIHDLHLWSLVDPARAVTSCKGVMNGITAVALASGQDTRAIEVGVNLTNLGRGHLPKSTTYSRLKDGSIEGRIDLRLPVGVVGGATGHPTAVACRRVMGIESASDLARVMAAVGLASNFAALRALCCEGIAESIKRLDQK
jgi:hydroxymethylglutaryl-CoA reductase